MRRSYRPGTIVKVCEGSGLDSGKVGVIIPNYSAKPEDGTYNFTSKDQVYIRLDSGMIITMWKKRLVMA